MKTQSFGLVLVLGAVAISLSVAAASAQEYKGTFKLDQQVRWGEAILPAGDYTLVLASAERGSIATIYGEHQSIMIMANAAEENASTKGSSLLLVSDRGIPSVRTLHLAEAKMNLYYPVGKPAMELEPHNQQHALQVPVAVSGK